MNPLVKFIRLSHREKRCLFLTFVLLHGIRLGLWLLSFQSLWTSIQRYSNRSPQWVNAVFPIEPPISELVQAIDTASWYTLKQARCLSRALTLYLLMRWFNYSPTLRIGVAKATTHFPPNLVNDNTDSGPPPAKFEAHAWIEYDKAVILGQLHDLDRFTPLPSIEQMN